jgi:hypothetical protein
MEPPRPRFQQHGLEPRPLLPAPSAEERGQGRQSSILGLEVGDEIRLTEADFRRLADGFLAEIERRY